ncbi:MAG: pectin acetylesterase-family hydrolase [Polyangiaceae bacterium]
MKKLACGFGALLLGSALGVGCGDDAGPGGSGGSGATGASGGAGGAGGEAQGGGGGDLGGGGAGGGGVQPIEATPDTWVWVPIEGTTCGNGSTAGVGVNLHEGSNILIVAMSGGGACWDDTMCNGTTPTSVHLHETLTEAIVAPEFPLVDRTDPSNPFSAASWVYVPYCTGDLHWGTKITSYTNGEIHHTGATNMQTILARVAATRPGTTTTYLLGGSAGGYGVSLHWGTTKQAFPGSAVHILADASPLVMPHGSRWATMLTAWAPAFPEACTNCEAEPGALLDTLATAYPTSRYALLSYDEDEVISQYFGFTGDLGSTLDAMTAAHFDPHPNTKYFIAPGTEHGVLGDPVIAPDGTSVTDFFFAWLIGAPTWKSERF